ncbi:unnamed protein product [Didymodactylos carnosus]|uniref:WSC domain-containing protein n=1 Tax=Didymodactylos carnosus TaxID=1234261 RepID=A0A814CZP9_9BILA|nr:unnamed protein product [Didymodactylos carnosus]CAF1098599.1 unnamed protein product [Didymodactylos carnosus]CAF3724945.1 unnamed protein product [Didymodactylos carnosus]CAF3860041.1 unnamed protein product [Didymodactylos carnosus]
MLSCLFLISLLIQPGVNQYLGCFIDQTDDRDLTTFVDRLDELTSEKCILACQKQNFPYAAVQYGNECRCGAKYGKYGQVSDTECSYLCLSRQSDDKCGGDNRNSVYSTGILRTDVSDSCMNDVAGYQGCYERITLGISIGLVVTIQECITSCKEYPYCGIMNGNLCYCAISDINWSLKTHPALCNIPCSSDITKCCGGLELFSLYDVNDYYAADTEYGILNRVRGNFANMAVPYSDHILKRT